MMRRQVRARDAGVVWGYKGRSKVTAEFSCEGNVVLDEADLTRTTIPIEKTPKSRNSTLSSSWSYDKFTDNENHLEAISAFKIGMLEQSIERATAKMSKSRGQNGHEIAFLYRG